MPLSETRGAGLLVGSVRHKSTVSDWDFYYPNDKDPIRCSVFDYGPVLPGCVQGPRRLGHLRAHEGPGVCQSGYRPLDASIMLSDLVTTGRSIRTGAEGTLTLTATYVTMPVHSETSETRAAVTVVIDGLCTFRSLTTQAYVLVK
jgi:hypothetical protein